MNTKNLGKASRKLKRSYQDSTTTDADPVNPSVSDSHSTRPRIPGGSDETAVNLPDYILGIDFGTTMTSISYLRLDSSEFSRTAVPSQIKFITQWPGAGQYRNTGEVPSEVIYIDGNMHWGYEAQERLKDYQQKCRPIDGGPKVLRFMKILLANDKSKGARPEGIRLREVREALETLGKSVRDVVEDYLTAVLREAKEFLKKHEEFEGREKVEFSMSVPAGWPMEATWILQAIIEGATKEIGFGRLEPLFIINEPEAASAFTLDAEVAASKTEVSHRESSFRLIRC
ncbi:hypothetical protein N7456_002550 [Penicillium angulare]|uniref:Uncharacterized protein n=1 Tax=Penicillium angulare TaxID=116970 RepID=A0A9W9KQD3_9EURO|nr:hypothetical protein N7456_002550 [Penicillium angulare]